MFTLQSPSLQSLQYVTNGLQDFPGERPVQVALWLRYSHTSPSYVKPVTLQLGRVLGMMRNGRPFVSLKASRQCATLYSGRISRTQAIPHGKISPPTASHSYTRSSCGRKTQKNIHNPTHAISALTSEQAAVWDATLVHRNGYSRAAMHTEKVYLVCRCVDTSRRWKGSAFTQVNPGLVEANIHQLTHATTPTFCQSWRMGDRNVSRVKITSPKQLPSVDRTQIQGSVHKSLRSKPFHPPMHQDQHIRRLVPASANLYMKDELAEDLATADVRTKVPRPDPGMRNHGLRVTSDLCPVRRYDIGDRGCPTVQTPRTGTPAL
ncbi:hypothetical protein Bbelb_438520 [Branchiostoma belcheri]|nr:hypothetical protein Bbelb_438520 [Branchiostoma belcheri]